VVPTFAHTEAFLQEAGVVGNEEDTSTTSCHLRHGGKSARPWSRYGLRLRSQLASKWHGRGGEEA